MDSRGFPLDPLNEYEPSTKIYTLTVLVPPRIPSRLSTWLDRKLHPVDYSPSNYDPTLDFKIGNGNPKYANPLAPPPTYELTEDDIPYMKTKIVKIKARDFPPAFRCSHVYDTWTYKCESGKCYLLERGGEGPDWHCGADPEDCVGTEGNVNGECRGHRWAGNKKKDKRGWWCFGTEGTLGKGERFVCIEK